MKDVASKYDLSKYIQYNHTIKSATWDGDAGKWSIVVQGEEEFVDTCDVFINASGILK